MPKARLVLQGLSPIAHFDTRTGIDNATNMRLTMRSPKLVDGRKANMPDFSGNALRSTLLRSPLGHHLVRALGIAGQLPRGVLNLLFAGGAMSGGRAPGDETAIGHAVYKLYPHLGLLGGAVDSMILPRSKARVSCWMVGRENIAAIEALFPEEVDAARALSLNDLVGEEVRTRGTGDEAEGNQMLYAYEVLAAGARIAVEIHLDPWTCDETGACLPLALSEWDGFIGGQGRQGLGRTAIAWRDMSDIASAPDAYLAHLETHGDAMREGLVSGTLGAARPLVAA